MSILIHCQRSCQEETYKTQGLVLVDPSNSTFYVREGHADGEKDVLFQSQPFLGGFEDFLSRTSSMLNENAASGPQRGCLLDDLLFYWSNRPLQGLNTTAPSLLLLSTYPLRIIAAEWMVYLQVMYHSPKQYEFRSDTISAALEQINILYADLSSLQKWGRRNLATSHKLRYVLDFLECHSSNDQDIELKNLLIKDYNHISLSIDIYGRRLNDMVPIVTSLIQIIDSRRSLLETTNISRLTHLALVFVPLSFISGLFGMNENIAPGGKDFWLYFVVCIPMCMIVYAIARPPMKTPLALLLMIWNSERLRRPKSRRLSP